MIALTEQDLEKLYLEKVKLPDSYFSKYRDGIPGCPIGKWNGSWAGHDFPRVCAVMDFIEWTEKHNLRFGPCLGYTCADDPEMECLSYEAEIPVIYPEIDLHCLSGYYRESFDMFLFNQTLEHLYNPFLAVGQIYRAMKPGGHVFTSVPTLNIPHSTPIHFGGYTPMGLAAMFVTNGFEVVEMGQWGNYNYIRQLWDRHDWPDVSDLAIDDRIPNEERNVCQCWILARKPLTTP